MMIIFAASSISQLTLLQLAANAMQRQGHEVLMVNFSELSGVSAAIRTGAEAAGMQFADFVERVARTELSDAETVSLAELTAWTPTEGELSYRAMFSGQRKAARLMLDEADASLLLVCEDGPGGCAALIAAAKDRRIPVLDMPFGIGESRDYDNALRDRAREGNLNLVPTSEAGTNLRRYAGNWIKTIEQGDATLMPVEVILARVAVGLDIEQPWVVHGGSADALLVESPAMERIYRREGVPAEKLVMTGSFYADAVASVLAAQPALAQTAAYGRPMEPERLSVLLAPPPSRHDTHAKLAEFATYAETVRRFVAAAKCGGRADVTVSLHPATLAEDRALWAAQGVAISEQWIIELIPRHDVLLTSFSSTSRWAIACGKPVVNYDMYRLDLSTYEGVAGVVELREMDGVERLLLAMASVDGTYARLAAQQRARGAEWGVLDGRAGERILKEVDRWIAGRPNKAVRGDTGYSRASVYAPNAQPTRPKHMFVWLGDQIERRHDQPASLLDVGAAAGDFLSYAADRFPQAELQGIEFDPALVAQGRERGRPVVQGDANDLRDLTSGQFEVVLMTGTHSIFEDFRTSLAECIRVAKGGGTVLVTGLFNPFPLDARIHWRYPAQWDAPWHPGYNMASMESVRAFLAGQRRVAGAEFLPFELPFDLAPQPDPVRSWTEAAGEGRRTLRNGIMQLPMHCLKIELAEDN
ncbi:methyltransferase domain-containing protein [Devosia oryziradicis]|uniref:Methyltransferase domain-containing protein n=1 Tax=Devosia oryziradicis TaxID=2801335 RepID=A0ABX7BXK0_9HYPH|nr:class I SAM-dependent methyltransferase [Devosia oryziradicis]QQR35337.1 methyltransferase domain-containing protein [Devosia oryziradicis]